jgi:hypothetical protein
MEDKFYIVPALSEPNTYFLFRDYGEEIKFVTKYGKVVVIGKGYLTPKELAFIRLYFI